MESPILQWMIWDTPMDSIAPALGPGSSDTGQAAAAETWKAET